MDYPVYVDGMAKKAITIICFVKIFFQIGDIVEVRNREYWNF
jgi:hypothetical protein